MAPRRFPPPWSVEDIGAAFVVRDANGQGLAYVYYEEDPGRRASAKLLTKDEARRIAANIAKLPKRPTPGQRGGVENWLAEKDAEDAAGQRWTLLGWALAGVLAGIIIVGAITLWLANRTATIAVNIAKLPELVRRA